MNLIQENKKALSNTKEMYIYIFNLVVLSLPILSLLVIDAKKHRIHMGCLELVVSLAEALRCAGSE